MGQTLANTGGLIQQALPGHSCDTKSEPQLKSNMTDEVCPVLLYVWAISISNYSDVAKKPTRYIPER